MSYILRRRKLGRTSCREIAAKSSLVKQVVRTDVSTFPTTQGFVFRWGTTNTLPPNTRTVNTADAIHKVADKAGFRRILADADLAPEYYGDNTMGVAALTPEIISRGVVVRPLQHHQGRHTYLCKTAQELAAAFRACPNGYYVSKFIDKVSEYRVFVSQGRAVWVAKKTPGNLDDVAWNVARGGRFDNVPFGDWPLKAVKKSIEAMALSDLTFGGVDIMIDSDGECYVLEINSAPSQTSPYRQSCVAKAFDWIVSKNSKDVIPMTTAKGGFRKFIHPSIHDEAILV